MKEVSDFNLLDKEFLSTLLENNERELYARITSLTVEELPIEQIEGRVTGGSINIDGDSNVRRSCSLTLIAQDVNISDYYWGLNTKFKLEIGVRNELPLPQYNPKTSNYPEIVWFPQGTYVITTFNTSLSVNNYTISISGKDKMCLLNGELGGQLFASVDFGQEETKTKILKPIKLEGTASSDVLTARTYYIKLDTAKIYDLNETENGESNPNYLTLQNSEKMSVIDKDNEKYEFVESDTGYYYRFENSYKIITKKLISKEENVRWTGKKYDIYKMVYDPSEMFTQVEFNENLEYEKGKYYYQASNGFYLLNTTNSAKAVGNNYTPNQLYALDYEYKIEKAPLEKIIRESVHAYAQEPYHNIIINDLDEYGLEQTMYKGTDSLYALRNYDTGHFENLAFKKNLPLDIQEIIDSNDSSIINFDALSSGLTNDIGTIFWSVKRVSQVSANNIVTYERIYELYDENNPNKYNISKNTPLQVNDIVEVKKYTLAEITFGTDIGYRLTDLTYTGDLISGIGESLTSILDKIKQMLGDFEYFYDVDGKFIFQKKRNFVNTSWSHIMNNKDETYVDYSANDTKFSFNFEGNRLMTAIANTPVLTNVKNDYSVWGHRKTLSGTDVPIHARYAIERKPKRYKAFNGVIYYTEDYDILLDEQISTQSWTKDSSLIPSFLNNNWYEFKNWLGSFGTNLPIDYIQNYASDNGFTDTITVNNENITLNNQFLLILVKNGSLYSLINEYDNIRTGRTMIINATTYKTTGNYRYYWDIIQELNNIPDLDLRVFIYNPILGPLANAQQEETAEIESLQVDWRELIYRMAIDYFAGQGCSEKEPIYDKNGNFVLNDPDHFLGKVAEYNQEFYPTGYTGYEQYYTDMQGFWRQLYNPDYIPKLLFKKGSYEVTKTLVNNSQYFTTSREWQQGWADDVEMEFYILQNSDVYTETMAEFSNNNTKADCNTVQNKINKYSVESDDEKLYWNPSVFEAPETLNFWIEFLDNGEELGAYQIKQIGDRQMVVNDEQVKAIYYKEVPDIILYSNYTDENLPLLTKKGLRQSIQDESGYTFVYLPKGFAQYLQISYRSKSAKDKIDELLYQHAYCVENISITALPIYHLQPNTRIFVADKRTGINGEYIVSKISLPLNYNGTMSITATKAPERIL